MDEFRKLVATLSRLPGVGRRSAERMAARLVRDPDGLQSDLMAALSAARERLAACSLCGGLTTVDAQPCRLCVSASREGHVVCVVEDPNDIETIEKSGAFHGRYHALMGKLSPMKGEGLGHLRIDALLERIRREGFREVILATGTDVEGEATASYLAELLSKEKVRVTRLAFGIPAGSGIAYSDPVTLQRAMKGRHDF